MKGKERCKILKEIRQAIAQENDIAFVTSECKHKGDCLGTCPACEAEVRYLERELEKLQKLGKAVAIAGLTAAITVSSTGCDFGIGGMMVKDGTGHPFVQESAPIAQVDGKMVAPEIINIEELIGIDDAEIIFFLCDIPRDDLRYAWQAHLIRQEESTDQFELPDGRYCTLYYNEYGFPEYVELLPPELLPISKLVDQNEEEILDTIRSFHRENMIQQWHIALRERAEEFDVFVLLDGSSLTIHYNEYKHPEQVELTLPELVPIESLKKKDAEAVLYMVHRYHREDILLCWKDALIQQADEFDVFELQNGIRFTIYYKGEKYPSRVEVTGAAGGGVVNGNRPAN